jgi:hypothetical protein
MFPVLLPISKKLKLNLSNNINNNLSNNINNLIQQKVKMDTTPQCSRVVPHPSTDRAQTALTSVIGRERVHYG